MPNENQTIAEATEINPQLTSAETGAASEQAPDLRAAIEGFYSSLDEDSLTRMSKYGIKSANDLFEMLESEGGKSVVKQEYDKRELLRVEIEELLQQAREAENMKMRILAYILLFLAYIKEEEAASLNEFMQQQIDHRLEEQQKIIDVSREEMNRNFHEKYNELESLHKDLGAAHNEKKTELQEVKKEQVKQHENSEIMAKNQEIFDQHMEKLDTFTDNLAKQSDKDISISLDKEIRKLQKEIDDANDSIEHLDMENENDIGKIRQVVDENDGRYARMKTLQERQKMHAAKMEEDKPGQLYIVTEKMIDGKKEFEFKETDSLKDANLALKPDQQLVKDGGKLYVLPKGKNINELNPEERVKAEKKFSNNLKTRSVESDIKNERQHSFAAQKATLQALDDRASSINKEMAEIENQQRLIKSAQSQLTSNMNQLNQNQPSMPSVKSGVNVNKEAPAPAQPTFPPPSFAATAAPMSSTMVNPNAANPTPAMQTNFNTTRAQIIKGRTLKQNILADMNVDKQNLRVDQNVDKQNDRKEYALDAQNMKRENRELKANIAEANQNKLDNKEEAAKEPAAESNLKHGI